MEQLLVEVSKRMGRFANITKYSDHMKLTNDVEDDEKEKTDDPFKDRTDLNNNNILPNTSQIDRQLIELRIPFQSLAVTTATCQISSLVFCLAWSVRFNFHESTATHCRVNNYLPSLSATLDFTPQRDVWRSCIGLSGIPRYFIAYLYYLIIFKSKTLLFLHWIEISALIGLSIVDSIKYFGK